MFMLSNTVWFYSDFFRITIRTNLGSNTEEEHVFQSMGECKTKHLLTVVFQGAGDCRTVKSHTSEEE
jgi:hypothetical protein